MDPNAVLRPGDLQPDKYCTPSILIAAAQKSVNQVDRQTLILAGVAEKAIQRAKGAMAQIVEKTRKPGDSGSPGRKTDLQHLDVRLPHHCE